MRQQELKNMSESGSESSYDDSESDSGASTTYSSSPGTSREPLIRARPAVRLPSLNLGVSTSATADRGGKCSTRPVQYDLLSSAFVLPRGELTEARAICSAKLGVKPDRIKFYELKEVTALQASALTGTHVAIRIQDSGMLAAGQREVVMGRLARCLLATAALAHFASRSIPQS